MLDYAKGAGDAALHFLGEVALRAEKVGVEFETAQLRRGRRGNHDPWNHGLYLLDVDAVVLPGEVKQAVARSETRQRSSIARRLIATCPCSSA